MNNNNVLTSNKKLRVRDKGRLVIMLFSVGRPQNSSRVRSVFSVGNQCCDSEVHRFEPWLRFLAASFSPVDLLSFSPKQDAYLWITIYTIQICSGSANPIRIRQTKAKLQLLSQKRT
ncbi:hypothetical protein GE061_015889 [Apolygus lucorum]|uniref:Uncharacterized protein n=1 Tax=Apolygus lucorum TaxID=248454 RepID=A0A8S9XMG2_APOLU|nr:hypothetical protein GE061_015889 [Apolygus lucorum]